MRFSRVRVGLGADVAFNLGVTVLAATSLLVLVLARVSQQAALDREIDRVANLVGLFQRNLALGPQPPSREDMTRLGEVFFLGQDMSGFALLDSAGALIASGGRQDEVPDEAWLDEIRGAMPGRAAARHVEWAGVFPFSSPARIRLSSPFFAGGSSYWLGLTGLVPPSALGRIAPHLLVLHILTYSAIPVVFGYFLLSRSVVRPVRRMAEVTRRIASGDIAARAKSEDSDAAEIAQLAESLNRMVQRIASDQETLADNIRSLSRVNEDLKRAQSEVVRAEKLASVGRLSAGVAHEIGNPLGAILGYLEILLGGVEDPVEARDYLARVEKETRRIRKIVEGLLHFARPGRKGWEPVDVNAVLSETLGLLGDQKTLCQVEVAERFSDGLPAVFCEPHLLEQMIVNLVLNAVDSMPEGGKLTVETEPIPWTAGGGPPGAGVSIRVSDTGSGIDPESLPKIFEPFFTTKEVGKGTGLGLAIVFWTVESFGGTIRVQSGRSEGTTFTIELPAAAKPEEVPGARDEGAGGHREGQRNDD